MKYQLRDVALTVALSGAAMARLPAQGGGPPPMDFSHPAPRDTTKPQGIPDAVLQAAIAAYNTAPNKMPSAESELLDATGTVGAFNGSVRIGGHVTGQVVVFNGDLKVTAKAIIDGRIIVLGGRLSIDDGAKVADTVVYSQYAPVARGGDGQVRTHSPTRTISAYTSTSFVSGAFRGDVKLSPGVYNRVEDFSVHLRPSLTWQPDPTEWLRLNLLGIARTATSPGEKRNALGGEVTLTGHTRDPAPIALGFSVGNVIASMADRPYPDLESGVGALVLRRDDRDWYQKKSWKLFGEWTIRPALTLTGSIEFSQETGVRAIDAFSILRSGELWRQNPLIDDGKYATPTIGLRWDTRDDVSHPRNGTLAEVALSRTSSHSLNPVTLPTSIRNPLSSSHYASEELTFDIRKYTRLSPSEAVHFRLSGAGSIGGDPMTLQRRVAVGGGDLLPGYRFRDVNCDPRRVPDPALPALCDKQLVAQAEFRQRVRLGAVSRIGPYAIDFQQPDLVFFADAGSAWRSGPGVGEVPSGHLQDLGEWRYDVGIGIQGNPFGFYIAKALTGHESLRFMIRFSPHF